MMFVLQIEHVIMTINMFLEQMVHSIIFLALILGLKDGKLEQMDVEHPLHHMMDQMQQHILLI